MEQADTPVRRPTSGDQDELLDIKQAAAFLKVSVVSLRRWTNAGLLRCLRVGGRRERRFRRSDLLAFSSPPEHPVTQARDQHGTHLCGLYATDAGRARQAASFLADGLGSDTVCYLVAEPEARPAVLELLRERRPTLAADIEAGQLAFSAYAGSGDEQLAFWESRFQEAVGAGARNLRVAGDVWGLAGRVSPEAVVEYERGFEERVARRFPVVTLCQYDARRFSGAAVLDALKGHPHTFRVPVERVLGS